MTLRSVVVTGASTGIGEACALHLDRLGSKVFAGVRKEADADNLTSKASGSLVPVFLDVTGHDQIREASEKVGAEVGDEGLDGLVNNAGVVVAGPLEFLDIADIRMQMEINVVGQVAVTQAFIPLLRAAKGRIVNMGSISGKLAPPFAAPYAASKHALEAITDALRVELGPWGIEVSIVEPGNIKTPIWVKGIEEGQRRRQRMPDGADELYHDMIELLLQVAEESGRTGISPNEVAKVVEHALTADKPKTRYLVGKDAKRNAFAARWVPDRLRDKLVLKEMDRMARPGGS